MIRSYVYVCVGCRLAQRDERRGVEVLCSDCHRPMVNAGLNFKTPRRTNIKQWRKVGILLNKGIRFYQNCHDRRQGMKTVGDAKRYKTYKAKLIENINNPTKEHYWYPISAVGRCRIEVLKLLHGNRR